MGELVVIKKDEKSMRILNRVVTCTNEGIEYEADQRHADIIINHLGLSDKDKQLGSPCDERSGEDKGKELTGASPTLYRGLTARGVYLSQDRSDIATAVKDLARCMSNPAERDMGALKKLGRYLIGRQRYIVKYNWQEEGDPNVWTDSDWAGNKEDRKSTS